MKPQEIKEKIFDGLIKSQRDSMLFRGEDFYKTKPEYIATVNIAKEISKLKKTAYDIIIKLEQNRNVFLNQCIPEPRGLFPKQKVYNFSKFKKQRIDIVLYKDEIPFCPIEIKLFRPSGALIIKDIERNIECLKIKGSLVKTSYFACLYYYKTSKTTKAIDKDKKRVKERFKKIVNLLLANSKLKSTVFVKTIKQDLIKKGKYNTKQIAEDLGDIYEKSFHFMGVIVRVYK